MRSTLYDTNTDEGISKLLTLLMTTAVFTIPRTDIMDYGFSLFDWLYSYSRRSDYVSLGQRMRVIDLEYTEFLKKPWDKWHHKVVERSLEDYFNRVSRTPHDVESGYALLRIMILRRLLMCYYVRSRVVLYIHFVMITILVAVLSAVIVLGTFT